MTSQIATVQKPTATLRAAFLSHQRWLMPTLVYAFLTVLCALAAYWFMFGLFQVYDDEGYFLYTLNLFVNGHSLYNSILTAYGPFYYLVFGGLYSVLGHGVTTDSGRLIQLTIWIVTSLGLGLTAHRLTGRLALGVASLATAFSLLVVLANEPMHPGALICLLLTVMVAVIAFVLPARPRAALSAVGALGAALLLTKINIGVYALIGIGFATVMASGSLVQRAALRWLAVAAFVLVGPAVMAGKLNTGWVRSYALLAVLSTLALVFVALPRANGTAPNDDSVRRLGWLIGGFIGCVVVVLSIVFALGTSPGALIQSIVVRASHEGDQPLPLSLEGNVVWWSLGAVVLAWTWRQRGLDEEGQPTPSLADGVLRLVAGLAILLSLASVSGFSIAPNAVFSLAMPLAWVAALPSVRNSPTPRERFARLSIPSVAILNCLQAYPVAGSQVGLGSILLVLCGAVCVADGSEELTAWYTADANGNRSARSALQALATALAVGTGFLCIVQPLETYHDAYRANTPLEVLGATRLRLPSGQASAISQVVGLVKSRCQTLITAPGMLSFNVWTGLPTPDAMVGAETYWTLLTVHQQLALVRAASISHRLCLVSRAPYPVAAPPTSPLLYYLNRVFRPIAQLPPYTVEVAG